MELQYITQGEVIIFSPRFNDKLDPELLAKYKTIIFSDYELSQTLFDNYESNNFQGIKCIGSFFNYPLGNSLHNLSSLTHLTFGKYYDHPLDNSLHELSLLTHLTFGFMFNQNLDNSLHKLSSLTHLTFGDCILS